MGNVKSRMKMRKKEEHGRPLPPELLYEITKFIPLTRIENRKMIKKKRGETAQCMIDIKNALLRKREPSKWDRPKMCIGLDNAKLLQCNSILTTYLRIRCNRILQIINDINNDYIYEKIEDLSGYDSCLTIISRKGTNEKPLTMREILGHVCFSCNYSLKYSPIILSEKYQTMPTDFKPDYFVDFLIGFTERTPHPEMISKCIVHLNEEQGKSALKALKKYRSAQKLRWRNWHKPEHEYELELMKENGKFVLIFEPRYYRLKEY